MGEVSAPSGSSFDPDNSYVDDELVVVDPPANFAEQASAADFTILERPNFSELDMIVYRVRVPRSDNVRTARRKLFSQFPGILVGANHQFDESQGFTTPPEFAKPGIRRLVAGESTERYSQ